jgi:hypothetical protein
MTEGNDQSRERRISVGRLAFWLGGSKTEKERLEGKEKRTQVLRDVTQVTFVLEPRAGSTDVVSRAAQIERKVLGQLSHYL